ncbi:MAG: BatA domain-containing protein [Planctomycetota bacterium]|nr:BatA domain-containing protein [Planctomycetota bacterium]
MGSLTNPIMLAAMAAVLIPPIIEWLFRRRKQRIDLPTIRFLLQKKEQEQVKRQDRILLLLRMLGIFLLVSALTRPLLKSGMVGGKAERNVVMLLDVTASTQQQVGMTTGFSMTTKKAGKIIRELPAGTKITVAQVGDGVDVLSENESDMFTVAARVERLRPGSGASPISEGLDWVLEYLERNNAEGTELYIFSDFQTFTWQPPGGKAAEVSKKLSEISDQCETYLVDMGGNLSFNAIATALKPEEWVMSTGMPVKFQAAVEIWGTPPSDARLWATFLVDGVKKGVQEIEPTKSSSSLGFEHRFASPGEFVVEVVVEGDEHLVDNRRLYLCSVPESVPVLILDESVMASPMPGAGGRNGAKSGTEATERDSSFFARAISPTTRPGMEKVSRFSSKVVHPSRIAYENLRGYGAAVVTDLSNLDESTVAKLEKYVADGGVLWLFLGPRVNIYDYNKALFKDGRGLMPAKLVSKAAALSGKEPPFVKFGESSHPALAELADSVGKDARFIGFFQLEKQPGTRTVLSLSDGTPAVMEKEYGRGKVLLTNTTVGLEWTFLPATVEFPIMVQELLRYLAGSPDASVNLTVGDSFEQPVRISTQHMLLRHPDGSKERLTPRKRTDDQDSWYVRFDRTRQQGLYEVNAVAEALPRRRFIVNQSSAEGDLTRLSSAEFSEAFGSGGWTWLGREIPVVTFASNLHSVTELAPPILWSLMLILSVESFLALRFGKRRGAATRVSQ